MITLRPQPEYETLKRARARQETDHFKTKYETRAGIEGTISQGTRSFNLRHCRYLGLAKTHLQHLATAAAMNLTRVVTWWLMNLNPNLIVLLSSISLLLLDIVCPTESCN